MTQGIDLVAHRGDRAHFPENTLPALRGAVEAGARYLEFDIQLSADGIPVLLHDRTLERTGGTAHSVFDLTASELQRLEVGEPSRFGERFAGVTVPTLRQAVALLNASPHVTALVEIKRHSLEYFGMDPVLDAVQEAMAEARFPWVLISFVREALVRYRERYDTPIGWVLRDYGAETEQRARELAPEYLIIRADRVPEGAGRLWPGPWRWVIYNVESVSAVRHFQRLGAELMETDHLGELLSDPLFRQSDAGSIDRS
ncbi:MAG: hypothetical protein Kow006_07880 [Gammaproteobacteria bacterium]